MYIHLYILDLLPIHRRVSIPRRQAREQAWHSAEGVDSHWSGCPVASDASRCFQMNEDNFEWDDAKREDNLKKHRIDFRDVPALFDGPFLLRSSMRRGEHRLLAIGFINGREATVVFTTKSSKRRIISA